MLRWVLWSTAAWLVFDLATFATRAVRFGGHYPLDFMLIGIALFCGTIALISAFVAALAAVPYAFAVARRPGRRFWGEAAPIGRVLLYVAMVAVPVGIAFAFTPQPTMTVTRGEPDHLAPTPRR